MQLDLILYVAAAVCFLIAFAIPTRVNFIPLGLLLWVLTNIVPR